MSSRLVDSVQTRAQQIAKEDYGKARVLFADGAKSRAYLYPIKGMFYFMTHRSLWKPFVSRILPILTLSFSVVVGMFFLTYLPQLAIMVFVSGPLAVFTTVLLVLNESSTIISIVSRGFLLQGALLDTFDGTLISRNEAGVVSEGRQLTPGTDPIARLGKILKNPFEKFSLTYLVRYVMYLPLNFIPVVGTIIFILLQGHGRGKSAHDRYFQLKKWSSSRRAEWLERHKGSYTAYGTVATLLEMIPFISILFSFTNTVGAALWAADIEARETQMEGTTAPNLREAADKAEKGYTRYA